MIKDLKGQERGEVVQRTAFVKGQQKYNYLNNDIKEIVLEYLEADL